MNTAGQWLGLASSNLSTARTVREADPRSACSRAYYAAYAAGHAILLHARELPREGLGTWAHADLPLAVKAVLNRGTLPCGQQPAASAKIQLECCRALRVDADYSPARAVKSAQAYDACRHAGAVVALAERMVL